MQVFAYDPTDVLINPATRARKGEPNPSKVKSLAENFLNRREDGREHQIQPGVVRLNEQEQPVLIAGEHRLEACKYLNSHLTDGLEPFPFYAVPVRADDQQSLIDAVTENVWREDMTIFDKADVLARLLETGMTQAQAAKAFKMSEAAVSDALACAKLPKKIQKMVTGDDKTPSQMTEEAAIVFARIKDKDMQAEVIELALQYQEALDSIAERSLNPNAETETADEAEDPEPAEEKKASKKAAKGSAPVSDAVKNKPKRGAKPSKGKITGETAKKAAKDKGASKTSSSDTKKRTAKNLITDLAVLFGPNVTEDIPASVRSLASKIEEYLDGDVGVQGLRNGFLKNCRED